MRGFRDTHVYIILVNEDRNVSILNIMRRRRVNLRRLRRKRNQTNGNSPRKEFVKLKGGLANSFFFVVNRTKPSIGFGP